MPPGNDSSRLEQLSARVETLERRIAALENPRHTSPPNLEAPASPAFADARSGEATSAQAQPNVLSVFGRAVLGIAGAYVLRAAAESGILPPWIAVTIAILYAGGWLAWAAWPGGQGPLARHAYAITAALILSPMMWEVTVSFRMFDAPKAAAILAGFAVLAVTLAWRFDASAVIWVGMSSAIISALILMVGTRSPAPFVAALLVMAGLSELAGRRGHWFALRPVVALAADLAVLILVVILGDNEAIPPEYHPVSESVMIFLVVALFTIYAVSLTVSSLILRLQTKVFEAAQFLVALLLASWSVVRITNGAGTRALGVSFLIAGAGCYVAAFGVFGRRHQLLNFRLFATFAVVFTLTGGFFALHTVPLVICLCLAAVIATGLCVHARSAALDLHGVVYLSGALAASGLLQYAGRALAGAFPPTPEELPLAAAAATLLCTAMISRYPGEHSAERVLRLLPAILAVYATAGLVVGGLARLTASGSAPTLPQLAVIRTVVTCAAALLLAYIGARRMRVELVWIAYSAAVLGSLKLILEDMRFGSKLSLAASLLIYGAVLILIPRLVRAGRPAH